MTNYRIDYNASFDIVMSTDALFLVFFDEPCFEEENEQEARDLSAKYPDGLHLIEYELIPDDYRAVVTVAPLIPDEFQGNLEIDLSKYIKCQVALNGNTVQYRIVKNYGLKEELSPVETVELKTNRFGLKYFSFKDSDKSMIYLKDFKQIK